MTLTLELTPGATSLETLRKVLEDGAIARLPGEARAAIERSAVVVARAAATTTPVYGVNTGFGKLAQTRISAEDTERLQRNLVLSHCCGVGDPIATPIVRLMMALKLLSLGRGASGVRFALVERLEGLLARGIIPVVPSQGSVGASGDLAPLAHMSAVLIGEGEAEVDGHRMPAREALRAADLEPLVLAPKEGLALINGTQCSTALALAALFETHHLLLGGLVTGAMSLDAAMGSSGPFDPEIHALRGHRGQIEAAGALRELIGGSAIRDSHRLQDDRVQDPYCLRCQPQVMGACLDLVRHAASTLAIEANAVTDNPLVFPETGSILSGGNFHAEPVAFAADVLALCIAELGSIAQRRIAMLVDPAMNFGLPPFLTPRPGINSGFMIAEVTSAALYAENKQRAAPCSIDSTPTSANQEDHVSMATHAARRLLEMNRNLRQILGIELLLAAQGIELRAPLVTSPALARVLAVVRSEVEPLGDDRLMAPDLERGAALIGGPRILEAVGRSLLPRLESVS